MLPLSVSGHVCYIISGRVCHLHACHAMSVALSVSGHVS